MLFTLQTTYVKKVTVLQYRQETKTDYGQRQVQGHGSGLMENVSHTYALTTL